ncbi:MAG TPA: hypothetical protein ENJ30_15070 [Desulfobulbaceae bacterium]|nr:hypothetical protein [Desulfobulbaceae bacterium]
MVLDLHFIRHGRTTAPRGALLGTTEVPLSKKGRLQCTRLGARLPKDVPCVCSPMLRTTQTQEELTKQGVVSSVIFDDRLREIDFGRWEMKTFTELIKEGADISAWQEYYHFCFPGGESIADFVTRLQTLADDWRHQAEKDKDRQLLIVSHGGVIRTMLCLLLGIDHKNYLLFDIGYGSWTTVSLHSQGGVLTGLNR